VSITNTPLRARNPAAFARDLAALSHLFNGVGSAAAVGIGYLATVWYYGKPIDIGAFFGAALATLCISNGGFIVNDILDLEIDRINRPDRPLAGGRVPVGVAWVMYTLYTLIGIVLALAISPATGLFAIAIAAGLFLYSAALKKRFLIGHMIVALSGALLFPFGGMAAGYALPALYSIPVTFFAFIAREILKTIPDAEGDKAHGVDNITTRYGKRTATRIGQWLLLACALSLPLMRLVWTLNGWFLAAVIFVIWPLTGFFLMQLSRPPDAENKNVKTVLRLSKLLFLLVALTILIGALQEFK
jgi:geranylgeranylglycerol-phosphate geranylgeranyltransferase